MPQPHVPGSTEALSMSPLVLSDRLLTLAEDAGRAGLPQSAEQLLSLAMTVLDQGPASGVPGPGRAAGSARARRHRPTDVIRSQ